ncbi:hypothetical protein RRG08_064196 [Elysia crispata]|uniref:Uncharacterized protein n=1 Tax=Elysia crispata TaxID=231223 RepID=A0AAE0ZGY9_9GAST|nr:hypothetical protein RRG08_064196 [Elysia crispata]
MRHSVYPIHYPHSLELHHESLKYWITQRHTQNFYKSLVFNNSTTLRLSGAGPNCHGVWIFLHHARWSTLSSDKRLWAGDNQNNCRLVRRFETAKVCPQRQTLFSGEDWVTDPNPLVRFLLHCINRSRDPVQRGRLRN